MIDPRELLVEVWPPRERGGQHVGTTSSGVKVTHIPSGTEAMCNMARSQHKNRAIAINMIECALTHPWS